MSSEGKTPDQAESTSASEPKRSAVERVLFWGFIVVSLGLVAFEARAKYGYDMTLSYLNTRLATEEFKIPKKGEEVKKVEIADPNWVSLQSEPFETVAVAAAFMPGSASEIKRFKPVVSRNADGTDIEIKDKNGTVLEVQPELNVERTLRWHSLRDLWAAEPVYQLTVVLANDDPDADVVAFDTSGGKNSLGDYFKNPERMAPSTFIPNQERSVGGGGGGFGGPPRPRGTEDKPEADTSDEKTADESEAAETKAEGSDEAAAETEPEKPEGEEKSEGDKKADDSKEEKKDDEADD